MKGDEQIDQSVSESIAPAVYVEDIPHFLDLQTKAVCIRHEEEDDKQKGPDLKQPTFNSEISKSSLQHIFNLQLDQLSKKVFLCEFDDPIADYLVSISSIDVKIIMSEEDYLYHSLKPLFCMIWPSLFFRSKSSMIPINQFLTWLHWKYAFT